MQKKFEIHERSKRQYKRTKEFVREKIEEMKIQNSNSKKKN